MMDVLAPFRGEVAAVDARATLLALTEHLRTLPQIKFELNHVFTDGIYARELLIPKGACLVGKIHLHPHMSFVLGDISIYSKDGTQRITGAKAHVASAGMKRAGYAHADTVWTTIHPNPTNERDINKLEALYIAPDFDALDQYLLVQIQGAVHELR